MNIPMLLPCFLHSRSTILLISICCFLPKISAAQVPEFAATIVQQFDAYDAYQGVAVDGNYFYAINNSRISLHDKESGKVLQQWAGDSMNENPLQHLDSGMVLDGTLYGAHSNYPDWPMTSSIESWDVTTMKHINTVSFGVQLGSFTWIDNYQGSWWGAFANYDLVQRGMNKPYGETKNTLIVKFDEDFSVMQSWTLPDVILQRMSPMSNSGGSWGRDGYLYLSGHDDPEVYVMSLPDTGSELNWLATISIPGLNGQGIAWDRSDDGLYLWAILRSTRNVLKIAMPDIRSKL